MMAARDDRRPPVLAQRCFQAHRHELIALPLAERFAQIHDRNMWGADTSVSGLGSEDAATAILRRDLPSLLKQLGVSTLLDAPCGDAGWIGRADLSGIRYVGVDIVPTLIERLVATASDARRFLLADITRDALPAADAILCRDCLVHLSFANILRAIDGFRRTGARWLIATTFTDLAHNEDVEDGDWRPLNLALPPFGWGAPAVLLVEGCEEAAGGWRDKSLGAWPLANLGFVTPRSSAAPLPRSGRTG